METKNAERLTVTVPIEHDGKRLDAALAQLFPEYSRARLQRWVREGHVWVDAATLECSDRVAVGATVEMDIPQLNESRWEAQALPLNVLHDDNAILVINKPPGLVVHPGAGNPEGTLLNALLHHTPTLKSVARAGIVHRLDKDTSGLLVVAKTDPVRLQLIRDLQARRVKREYLAVVHGLLETSGTIEAPIGRHPVNRTRMAVQMKGKAAISHYSIKARYRAHTLVAVRLESGRTHQIRVHMAHIGHPVLGDPAYGIQRGKLGRKSEPVPPIIRDFPRQALHAARLGLLHPTRQEAVEWTAPAPRDMQALIEALEE